MKINITARGSARIYLTSADMQKLDIPLPQSDVPEEAKLFAGGIAAFLSELGLIELGESDIQCSVSEAAGGIIIDIGSKDEDEKQQTQILFVFESADELCDFCRQLPAGLVEKAEFSELHKADKSYCLIIGFCCAGGALPRFAAERGAIYDSVRIQKAREYGELLSRTPIKTIREITDP